MKEKTPIKSILAADLDKNVNMGCPPKWTDERVINLADKLLQWIKKDGNVFCKSFLVNHEMYGTSLNYLLKLDTEGGEYLRKAYDLVKEIQESKLIDGSLKKGLHSTMAIFVLKNHHGYKDVQEVTHINETPVAVRSNDLVARLSELALYANKDKPKLKPVKKLKSAKKLG